MRDSRNQTREHPDMTIKQLDHVNIHTADLASTVDFYAGVIGLEQGERPTTIGRPGAWLYCEGRPLIHLIEIDQSHGAGTGVIDHVAFDTEGYDTMVSKLTERGLTFEAKELSDFRIRQIFVHDPNGVKLELNFRGT
jgi:catechol 2,3-dioxygenase-like lactoylglutathione lyase family enzyme